MMDLMKRLRLRKTRKRQGPSSSLVDERDVTLRALPGDCCSFPTKKRFALKDCTSCAPPEEEHDDYHTMVCMICHEDDTENDDSYTRLTCGHSCHATCISQWIERSNSCPMCRCEIATEVLVEEDDDLAFLGEGDGDEEALEQILASTLGVQRRSTNNHQSDTIDDLLASCIYQSPNLAGTSSR
mmetsp:Transcript_124798/g.186429  ORF Transcript_124798/g.186429 Transcript_124798/m.186429 type:complete len:184 (+) Transcript_124798:65-616(+)|eukprot:CAMPEP_0117038116 /NCGR_PEP_ID=MMETSP0472-20121206/26847_1 /TAXON_ID=693140 ORGANISM="Tiarina fusus, Strain LIS" /NCGR_SAMPLE_ID=MMETSP0472 /ASSEMBLY_ACC=CAM_ASM_000603 /LENGTH=183 /DNA_ID=CAMNT_0004748265 /DNA_START=65 /DNA_END=616 /DNA_ORIENTATION=-